MSLPQPPYLELFKTEAHLYLRFSDLDGSRTTSNESTQNSNERAKDLLSAFCRTSNASTTVHILTSLSSKRKEPQELGTVITPLSSGETEVR